MYGLFLSFGVSLSLVFVDLRLTRPIGTRARQYVASDFTPWSGTDQLQIFSAFSRVKRSALPQPVVSYTVLRLLLAKVRVQSINYKAIKVKLTHTKSRRVHRDLYLPKYHL